jgi:hypothetical protein
MKTVKHITVAVIVTLSLTTSAHALDLGAGVSIGSDGIGAGVGVSIGSVSIGAGAGVGSDGVGAAVGGNVGSGTGSDGGTGSASNLNGQGKGRTHLTSFEAETEKLIGATFWSSDRVFLGEVISASPAPAGQVDAWLRLSSALSSVNTTLIRFDPKGVRGKKFIMKTSSQEFMSRILN